MCLKRKILITKNRSSTTTFNRKKGLFGVHQHNFSEFEKTLIELKLQRQEDPEMMNIKMI